MSAMRELLTRWMKLEPIQLSEEFISFAEAATANPGNSSTLAELQWMTQEAITQQGWDWGIYYTKENYGLYTGQVWVDNDIIEKRSENSAEALLLAYTKALEAVRETRL